MLKEFVEAIGRLAVKAQEPKILEVPGNLRHWHLQNGDGSLATFDKDAPLRKWQAGSLEAFVDIMNTHGENGSVWHRPSMVVGVLDNEDRREFVTYRFERTAAFRSLEQLPCNMDQRALCRFLRLNLNGLVDNSLIAIFANIDFSQREQGSARIAHGDESLGRSVQAEAKSKGSEGIPQILRLSLNVYQEPAFRLAVPIGVDVEIMLPNPMFCLTVFPDHLQEALQATSDHIQEVLSERCECPVYQGRPFGQKDGED